MNTDRIYAEAIVNEYSKKSASKVVALKKLDRRAKLPSLIFAYTFGVVCTLIAGFGMCLCLGALGDGGAAAMAVGVGCGVLGFLGAAVNYPIYKRILQRSKDRFAGDILRLASEIAEEG